jgi:hypothetical protein
MRRPYYGKVGHVGRLILQKNVEPGQARVELGQPIGIKRMAPGQLGLERHVAIIIPDSVRDEQIDAFGVLLHRHGVDGIPSQVTHGTVGLGHHQAFVPVGATHASPVPQPS